MWWANFAMLIAVVPVFQYVFLAGIVGDVIDLSGILVTVLVFPAYLWNDAFIKYGSLIYLP